MSRSKRPNPSRFLNLLSGLSHLASIARLFLALWDRWDRHVLI